MIAIIAVVTIGLTLSIFIRNLFLRETATVKINWTIWACDQAYLLLVFTILLALLKEITK